MKKILFGAIALTIANCTYAQKDATAEKFAKYISVDDARTHLTIIASDAFEGRETGKHGADLAANYIAAQFKELGLEAPVKGSYFLDIPLVSTASKVNSFVINGQKMVYGKDFSGSVTTDGSINTGEVIFIGYATEADLNSVDLKGKIILLINEDKTPVAGESTRQTRARKRQLIKAIQAKGPALILAIAANSTIRGVNGQENLAIKKDKPAAAPQSGVFNIGAFVVDALLKNNGKTLAQLKQYPTVQVLKANVAASYHYLVKDVKAVDVVGFLPGSDPKLKNEVLVFSAHYDHIGIDPDVNLPDRINNGADDDGSGTTGIIEIARAFTEAKKQGQGPRRSVLFLGNVGEEKGLLGSEYYSDHPVFPLANTITDLNIDMIGRRDPAHETSPDYCYLIGSDKLSTTLHKISENANNTYTQLAVDYKYNDPKDPEQIYYRSDHYNFARYGVPIVFYFDGVHADYHKPSDEVSKIDFPLLVKRAQLVYYTGWDLANRDRRPVVDVVNNMPQAGR